MPGSTASASQAREDLRGGGGGQGPRGRPLLSAQRREHRLPPHSCVAPPLCRHPGDGANTPNVGRLWFAFFSFSSTEWVVSYFYFRATTFQVRPFFLSQLGPHCGCTKSPLTEMLPPVLFSSVTFAFIFDPSDLDSADSWTCNGFVPPRLFPKVLPPLGGRITQKGGGSEDLVFARPPAPASGAGGGAARGAADCGGGAAHVPQRGVHQDRAAVQPPRPSPGSVDGVDVQQTEMGTCASVWLHCPMRLESAERVPMMALCMPECIFFFGNDINALIFFFIHLFDYVYHTLFSGLCGWDQWR